MKKYPTTTMLSITIVMYDTGSLAKSFFEVESKRRAQNLNFPKTLFVKPGSQTRRETPHQ